MLKTVAAAALLAAAACRGSESPLPQSVRRTQHPATPSPTNAPRDCRYAFPIRPASAASFGRAHHDYPATDLFAPAGTEVVSVVDGSVDFVSHTDRWEPGADDPAVRGGLSFAVIGEDGIRYYGSHLRDLDPALQAGATLEAGRLVGHVGTTGNARGTPPHLHFGISRPTEANDWKVRRGEVSPFDYLSAWKQDRPRTPSVPGARPPSCRPMS